MLPAHFTAASMWVEALRLLADTSARGAHRLLQRAGHRLYGRRSAGTLLGFYLAASLPLLLTAALLFLTPMTFLVSTARNARVLADRLALGFGLVVGPLLGWAQIGLDLMWTGIIAGSAAYALHRLREALR